MVWILRSTGWSPSGGGRGLIEHAYAEALDRGAPRVYWTTHQSSHGAPHRGVMTIDDKEGATRAMPRYGARESCSIEYVCPRSTG